jgi:hypothetical protein
MNSFVLTGKAETVFRLLRLKAQIEAAKEIRERAARELNSHRVVSEGLACPFSPTATCSKPECRTCAEVDCQVWREINGE